MLKTRELMKAPGHFKPDFRMIDKKEKFVGSF